MRDIAASGTDQGRFDRATIARAELPLVKFADSDVHHGRPSVAEAEAWSGRILDASRDVLLVGGVEHFTFDRLARHSHIGKATIYSRFLGKGELMCALLARRIEMHSDFFNRRTLTWRIIADGCNLDTCS